MNCSFASSKQQHYQHPRNPSIINSSRYGTSSNFIVSLKLFVINRRVYAYVYTRDDAIDVCQVLV